jgi:hypothetical protein
MDDHDDVESSPFKPPLMWTPAMHPLKRDGRDDVGTTDGLDSNRRFTFREFGGVFTLILLVVDSLIYVDLYHASSPMDGSDLIRTLTSLVSSAYTRLNLMRLLLDPTTIGPLCSDLMVQTHFLLHTLLVHLDVKFNGPDLISPADLMTVVAPPPELSLLLSSLRRFPCFEGLDLRYFSCEP